MTRRITVRLVDSNDVWNPVSIQVRHQVIVWIENAVVALHFRGVRNVFWGIIARVLCEENSKPDSPAGEIVHQKIRFSVAIEIGDSQSLIEVDRAVDARGLNELILRRRLSTCDWFNNEEHLECDYRYPKPRDVSASLSSATGKRRHATLQNGSVSVCSRRANDMMEP